MPGQLRVGRVRRRWRTRPLRAVASAALALALAAGGPAILAVTSPAGAQTIDGLQAEADQLSSELAELRSQVEGHAEDYNRARARVADAEAEVQRFAAELGATRADFDQRRQQLAAYAVQAYVQGGDVPAVDGLVGGDPDALTRRLSYLRTAAGDRKALVDRLRVSEEDLALRIARVDAARAEAAAGAQEADAAGREAEAAEARIGELLGQVEGRLGELLREAEARRAAEEARLAEEARQASAAAAAAAASDDEDRPDLAGAPDGAWLAPAARPVARTPAPAGVGSGLGAAAVAAAMTQLGVPYVYGGESPEEGFDCSGLVQWAWGVAGRSLSRPADYQRDDTQPISESELQPGDLVFYGEPPSHDAIYIGDGQIINAPYTGEVVRIQSMYYSSKPMTFGRVN